MNEETDAFHREHIKEKVIELFKLVDKLQPGDTLDIHIENSAIAGWIMKFDATIGTLGKQ